MRSICAVLLFTMGLAFQTSPAQAWGPNGHRIVARIAEDNLLPGARTALQAIAGKRSLALLATWPDFVRSFPQYDCLKPLHFLTVEDGQPFEDAMSVRPFLSDNCDKSAFDDLEMPANVVAAIAYFTAILQGDNQKSDNFAQMLAANGAEPLEGSVQLTALSLLVHLVGDVHQPLHVGRGPDRGGNTVTVDWFDDHVNLHEVWDVGLIDKESLSYSEFSEFLEQEFAEKPDVEFGEGPSTWAMESVEHREAVYAFGGNPAFNVPRLSYKYAADQNALLQARLHKGGMRLAEVLNRILGN